MSQNSKVGELSRKLKSAGLDAIIVGPSPDLEYLSGLHFHPDERFKALLTLVDGRFFHIIPELYYEEAREKLGSEAKIYVWSDSDGFLSAVNKAKNEYGINGMTIGVNDGVRAVDLLDMKECLEVSFKNGTGVLERMRLIKSGEERDFLRKAADIADRVMSEVIKYIRPGLLERDISNKIEELFLEYGGQGLAFDSIVASGPNTSRPHYNKDDRRIEEKDIIILDFGCRYNGFCSDISRTVFVGEPTEEQRKIFDIVVTANTKAEELVKPGVTAGQVDLAARTVIREAGYGHCFLNRTGHGIGMAVHEGPYIKEGNTEVLEPGMTFSVEPGIYIAGRFGMRVENIVLVTENGREILNKSTKDIIIV
ncbi:MAG TPA: Xaa-Pro peptidase family protein [Clostridia bacterium]|nr:Xaa-Pro peptidase family protein [Clostridia bacterium]